MSNATRDHGGGLDAAIARFGGVRAEWVDLSTGINPAPYTAPVVSRDAWTALPDSAAQTAVLAAARRFWGVPDTAAILAAPGASALIAQLPGLVPPGAVNIVQPTYNEHAAAFDAWGWTVADGSGDAAQVVVHPNNPTGAFWLAENLTAPLTIIDESFCDIAPERSLMHLAERPGVVILKSFGKFWGLAGLRLGFAIGDADLLAQLADRLGPWPVSGPALEIGAAALCDTTWAENTRRRLTADSARLDAMVQKAGGELLGGTPLFRLYDVGRGADWQTRLAQHHVWSRVFPYAPRWLRLGLPGADRWDQVARAFT